MIYDNVRYKLNQFCKRPFVVSGNSHYFYFNRYDANYDFPEQLRIDVEHGFVSNGGCVDNAVFYIRVDCADDAINTCAFGLIDGDTFFEVPITIDVELWWLYDNIVVMPEITAEIKAEIAELPEKVQNVPDEIKKQIVENMVYNLSLNAVIAANPDLAKSPIYDIKRSGTVGGFMRKCNAIISEMGIF